MELISLNSLMMAFAITIFVSILVTKMGTRYGMPTLFLFLIVGILFGSEGLGIEFSDYAYTQDLGSVALAIILFSGGMETRIKEIQPVMWQGVSLSTVGVLLTSFATGFFIWWLSGMEWSNIHFPLIASLLLAATMSSTDSASVFAILREKRMNLKHNLRPMLELESGSNDPMAYMLTIVLIDVAMSASSGMTWDAIAVQFLKQFAIGAGLGWACGRLCAFVINRMKVANPALYPIMLLSLIFFTFALTAMCEGNSFLSVYLAGIIMGNRTIERRKEIDNFTEVLAWLMQIWMFLTLGLLVNPSEMLDMALVSVLIGLFMMFVARPLSVFVSLLPFRHVTFKSRLFVSWVGLRGAAPIIFATYPVMANVEGCQYMFNIVFFITLLSLIIQGMSLSAVANWLDLSLPFEDKNENFGVEIPDELKASLTERTLTDEDVADAPNLIAMQLPSTSLVIMIRRGEQYVMPNGSLPLRAGDTLLIMEKEMA
ncbi:MAG: potassium/proton antiporter [Bacteroidaceae bacterium]|nr:potassium/proton antiporter [Bacteroidaceae bacterium]